jgi:hypothetical protein
MRRVSLVVLLFALAGCGGRARYTHVPNNFDKPLDQALRRLHDAGLRVSYLY